MGPNNPPALLAEPSAGVPDGLPNNPVVDVVDGAAEVEVLKVIELVAEVGLSVTSVAMMLPPTPASSSPCTWLLVVCPSDDGGLASPVPAWSSPSCRSCFNPLEPLLAALGAVAANGLAEPWPKLLPNAGPAATVAVGSTTEVDGGAVTMDLTPKLGCREDLKGAASVGAVDDAADGFAFSAGSWDGSLLAAADMT